MMKAKRIWVIKKLFKFTVILAVIAFCIWFYVSSLKNTGVTQIAETPAIADASVGGGSREKVFFQETQPTVLENLFSQKEEVVDYPQCKITILDVGQGLCVLVESNGEYLIFDGGDKKTASYVVAYCRQKGITSFKYMVASHYHADHIYGLCGILESGIKTEVVICPDYETTCDAKAALLERIREINVYTPYAGEKFLLGDIEIICVAPAGDMYSDDNGYSIGLRISYGDFSLLLNGDSTQESEEDMLGEDIELASDIIIVGHHGSTYSSCEEFLDRVGARIAVISCGKGNEYYHPHVGTLNRLKQSGVTSLYRTDLNGTIEIECTQTGYEIVPQKVCKDSRWLWEPGTGQLSNELSGLWETTSRAQDYYIGNKRSSIFHSIGCEMLPKEKYQVFFKTREDALESGYYPCGNCEP